jgi:hypothetical protein
MPGQTPVYNFTYPIPTDLVINGPQTIQQLAEDVETVVQTVQTGAVPTSRTITAGNGLTGGGDLTANRTLNVDFGTLAGTAAQGNDSRIVNAVPNSREVIAGQGLTGGGDLTVNRTLGVVFGSTGGTVAEGNDSRIVNAVPGTRQVIAGTGLTGGGALSSNVTLTVNSAALVADPLFQSTFRSSGESLYVPAASLIPSGATRQVVNDAAEVLQFDDGVDEYVLGSVAIPSDWATASMSALVANASTGAGNYRLAFSASDSATISSITAVDTVVTAAGSQDVLQQVDTAAFAVTQGSLRFKIERTGTDVGDTLANEVNLLGVVFVRVS